MAQGLTFYVNSTAPSLSVDVKRGTYPIDLTGATVYFQMVLNGQTALYLSNQCVVLYPPVNGQIRYDWKPGDLAKIGNYLCNLFIVYPNGTTESTETTNLYVVDTLPPTLPNIPST